MAYVLTHLWRLLLALRTDNKPKVNFIPLWNVQAGKAGVFYQTDHSFLCIYDQWTAQQVFNQQSLNVNYTLTEHFIRNTYAPASFIHHSPICQSCCKSAVQCVNGKNPWIQCAIMTWFLYAPSICFHKVWQNTTSQTFSQSLTLVSWTWRVWWTWEDLKSADLHSA